MHPNFVHLEFLEKSNFFLDHFFGTKNTHINLAIIGLSVNQLLSYFADQETATNWLRKILLYVKLVVTHQVIETATICQQAIASDSFLVCA